MVTRAPKDKETVPARMLDGLFPWELQLPRGIAGGTWGPREDYVSGRKV